MASLQDLREERAALAREIHNLLDGDTNSWNPQTKAACDAKLARAREIDERIEIMTQAAALSDDLDRSARERSGRNGLSADENAAQISAARRAFANALRGGVAALTPEERGFVPVVDRSGRIIQNVAEGTNSAGGYMVPTILMPTLLEKLKAFGGMRAVANVISTSGGYPIAWATVDDTASAGELVAENVSATTGDLTFSTTNIGAWKWGSKIVPVSFEVLQDAAVPIEAHLIGQLATRIARGQNGYFTNGTGVSQPQGALTAASLGYTMPVGNTTAVSYAALVNLYHALDPAYRGNPGCAFMFNDATFKALKLLVDGAGRPIWLPSTAGALSASDQTFDTLLGKRIVINQDMPSMAASAKPVLFGDFGKYLIRDVMETQVFRFTDSAYVAKGQIGFLAWARADGRLVDASNASMQYLANSAT